MELLTHIRPLTDAVTRVRQGAAAFSSTFFANREQIESWIGRGSLFYGGESNGVFILRQDRDFFHVYHVAADIESISIQIASLAQISQLRNRTLIADLVGRPDNICTVANLYSEHGFHKYSSLFRMVHLNATAPSDDSQDPEVMFATEADAQAIVEFLEQLLDPFVDQIPDTDDLRDAATRRNILIMHRGGLPAGVLIFERTGLTTVLRYWYVRQESRGHGIGSRLIRALFRLCRDGRRIVLWVADNNADGIAKYQHYGFKREHLADQIMMREKAT